MEVKNIYGIYFEHCQMTDIKLQTIVHGDMRMDAPVADVAEKASAEKPFREAVRTSFSLVVINADCPEKVILRLHELIDKQTSPKDVVMPIRAAMEAGVIRRPTWGEFCAEFGDNKLRAKSSFSRYTESAYQYEGEDFKVMIENFRTFLP